MKACPASFPGLPHRKLAASGILAHYHPTAVLDAPWLDQDLASILSPAIRGVSRSFASVAGDLGFADSTISAMLGHSVGTVTSRYVHCLDAVLVVAANKVAAEVSRQMTGKSADIIDHPARHRGLQTKAPTAEGWGLKIATDAFRSRRRQHR